MGSRVALESANGDLNLLAAEDVQDDASSSGLESQSATPHSFEALSIKAGTSASTCGFLAGFAYYELSRLSEQNADRVPRYPVFLLGAFTFSVVCNASAAFVEMRVVKDDAGQLHDTSRAMERLGDFAYLSFHVALLLYAGAIGQMVDVFNPTAVEKSHLWGWFWHALFLYEQYYLYVMIAGLLVLGIYFRRIRARIMADEASDKGRELVAVSAATSPESTAKVEEVMKMSGLLGSRALFMLGFVHHSLARYQYHVEGIYVNRSEAGTMRTPSIWFNAFFWHFIILSSGCLVAANFIAVLLKVLMNEIPASPPHLRMNLLARISWVWTLCKQALNLGMFFVLAGAMLTGWGCSGRCNLESVTGGACYADVAYVPASMCGFALVTVLIMMIVARHCARAARRRCDLGRPGASQQTVAAITLIGYIGNSATIAAGFVMYNIATFDTDILNGPITNPDVTFGLTVWGYSFLWANWIAFALGMAAALVVLVVESEYYALPSEAAKACFVESIQRGASRLSGGLFALAMCAFVVAFGLFGLAKMAPIRVESAVAALIGSCIILAELWTICRHHKQASKHSSEDARARELLRVVSERFEKGSLREARLKQLGTSASRSLLFGGFAYNAVSFLFRPAAVFAPTYTIGMGTCFASGVYVTLCDSTINMLCAQLASEEQKILFVFAISGSLERLRKAGVFYIMCFLCSFVVMGYIKLWSYSDTDEATQIEYSLRFGWLQLVGGLISLGILIPWLWSIRHLAENIRDGALHALEESPLPGTAGALLRTRQLSTCQKSWNARADAAVFMTGNVFYEILFSALGMQTTYDYAYFSLSVLTLVLGSLVVAVASTLLVWSSELQIQKDSHSTVFASMTWTTQVLLKCLYIGSLYSWMSAMLFSSAVKYASLWYASAAWSGLGLVLITIIVGLSRRAPGHALSNESGVFSDESSSESVEESEDSQD